MIDFEVGNNCSINLNFIIYINNFYENIYYEENKFPYIIVNKKGLLSDEIIFDKLSNIWSETCSLIKKAEDDMDLWIDKLIKFESLFAKDEHGLEVFGYVFKTFESWYWNTGNNLCYKFSDEYVEYFYNELIEKFKCKGIIPVYNNLILQVIYDEVPKGWSCENKRMIFISPGSEIPTVEKVFNNIF